MGWLAAIGLVIAACGGAPEPTTNSSAPPPTGDGTSAATSTTPAQTGTTTTTTTLAQPPLDLALADLNAYRFRVSLSLAAEPLAEDLQPISSLTGERTTSPESAQIFGDLGADEIRLVSDGVRWWDVATGEELESEQLERSLAAIGFLLPGAIEPLLRDEAAWRQVREEAVAGIRAVVWRRESVVKDVDWDFGDAMRLDVWRNDAGDILKYRVWFATGDNTGFPVAGYEITEINPDITIDLPET